MSRFSEIRFPVLFFFLIITISSAVFRITNLSLIEFKADESINLFLASRPLFGHPFPPGGTVSSVGILNPPLLNYILFPFLLISLDPKIISFCIGLLNSFAIGFLFLIINRYYGLKVAFIASILLAFSPWSIIFSRKIWAQDFIFIFTLPLFFSLHKIILERKMIYWILLTCSSLFLIQLHQSTIFFLLPFISGLFLQKVKFNIKYITIGLIIGLLPLIPYLLYQISNHQGFLEIAGRLAFRRSLSLFLRPFQILGQGDFQSLLGGDMLTFANYYPIIYKLKSFFYIEYLFLPISMFLFWKKFKQLRLLTYITFLLPFIYFIFRIEPLMHYYIIFIPFLFLFLSFGISFFINLQNILIRGVTFLILFSLISLSIIFNFSFFKLLDKQKEFKGDYGSTFAVSEEISKEIFHKYEKQKEYQEMIIASRIPSNLIYGNHPLAKMIYSRKITENRITELEKRLLLVPEDARIKNELMAYFTYDPTHKTLELLIRKAEILPYYQKVYNEAYSVYLTKNLKNLYDHGELDFALEYPSHWSLKEYTQYDPKKVVIKGDGRSMSIVKLNSLTDSQKLNPTKAQYQTKNIKVLEQTINKMNCVTSKKEWCGTMYASLRIADNYYQIFYHHYLNDKSEKMPKMDQNLLKTIKAMDQIVNSLRTRTPF